MWNEARKRSGAVLVTLVVIGMAEMVSAEEGHLRMSLEQVFHPTAVDTNGDGQTSHFFVSHGRSNLGPVTHEGWAEFLPFDGASFCGPTHVQLAYRFADGVFRFRDGSRLFTAFSSGALCFNFVDQTSHSQGTVQVIGGTGRFEGAQGELAYDISSVIAFASGFGATSSKWEGMITLP